MIEAHKLLRVVLSGPATLESLKRLVPVPRSLELMFDPCSEPQYRSEMRRTSVIGHDVRKLLPLHAVDAISINNYLSGGGSHRIARPLECFVSRGPRRESAAARQWSARGVAVTRSSAAMARVSQRCCAIEMTLIASPRDHC